MPAPWTLFELTGDDLPADFFGDYSIRGITMTLTLIDQAKRQRRTINGALKDVSKSQMRKYRGTISCTDRQSPRLAAQASATKRGLVGAILGLKCVQELGTRGENTDGSPEQLALNVMVEDWDVTRDDTSVETGWVLQWAEV